MSCSAENAAAAADLCRLVAPRDLDHLGAYVVPFTAAAGYDGRLRCGRSGGWTMPGLDMLLRPWLRERGQWVGRGFACIWRDDVWAGDVAAAAVALHEAAHWFDTDALFATVDEEVFDLALPDWGVDRLPTKFASPEYDLHLEKTGDCPWTDHGARFIRAALHLHRRAELLGIRVPLDAMNFAGFTHGLTMSCWYQVALCGEAEGRASEPLRAVLASPAPKLFERLWAIDTLDEWWTDENIAARRAIDDELREERQSQKQAGTDVMGESGRGNPRVLRGGAGDASGDFPANFSRLR